MVPPATIEMESVFPLGPFIDDYRHPPPITPTGVLGKQGPDPTLTGRQHFVAPDPGDPEVWNRGPDGWIRRFVDGGNRDAVDFAARQREPPD